MPASDAQIAANRQNAQSSTGPKTAEGKERSRANAFKHGLTGEGIVLPIEDAAEVERLQREFEADFKPCNAFGRTLVRRMALMAVRMDRSVAQETANLTAGIHQARVDFDAEWPAVDGENDPERDRMRTLAANLALFDPSPEATLARKYEAAAERCFFRSLKELRQVEKESRAMTASPEMRETPAALGSFLPGNELKPVLAAMAASPGLKGVVPTSKPEPKPTPNLPIPPQPPAASYYELPFTIGRAR